MLLNVSITSATNETRAFQGQPKAREDVGFLDACWSECHVPHPCRRTGHAGLAGAIFEYGRNLGTGDWSTLSHLSDVDSKPQTSIRPVLAGPPSLKAMVRHGAGRVENSVY